MSKQVKQLFAFGPYVLDTGERLLKRGDALVPLTPKALETLAALVRHGGRVVEKEELLKAVWPDTYVEERTLAQNIFTLRRALGEGGDDGQKYIETIPRRGYRFTAPVVAAGLTAPPVVTRPRLGAFVIGAALVLVLTLAVVLLLKFSVRPRVQ